MNPSTRVYAPRGANSCSIPDCQDRYYGAGFCKKHHQWHWKRGLLPQPTMISIAEKLKEHYVAVPESGCWLWIMALNNKGYGSISLGGGRREYVHRTSYRLHVGEIPDGMEVCHACDVPCCINPSHLFLGTHQENMSDSASKGRNFRIPPRPGQSHHAARLKGKLLDLVLTDPRSAPQLAAIVGCCAETVRRARRGDTYAA